MDISFRKADFGNALQEHMWDESNFTFEMGFTWGHQDNILHPEEPAFFVFLKEKDTMVEPEDGEDRYLSLVEECRQVLYNVLVAHGFEKEARPKYLLWNNEINTKEKFDDLVMEIANNFVSIFPKAIGTPGMWSDSSPDSNDAITFYRRRATATVAIHE